MRESIDQIILRLRQDFLETCRGKLRQIDALVISLETGNDLDDEAIFRFRRDLHSIKGQGGTFGFPLITQIAHRLEDYLASVGDIRAANPNSIRAYAERIAEVVGAGNDPSPALGERILRALPVHRAAGVSDQTLRDVRVHLAMANGTHPRMVRHELDSCGFQVIQTDNAMEALASILAAPPDIAIASQVLEGFSGIELARVLRSIDSTRHVKFVLLTSDGETNHQRGALPPETAVIAMDTNYARRLADHLLEWGVFGTIGKVQAG